MVTCRSATTFLPIRLGAALVIAVAGLAAPAAAQSARAVEALPPNLRQVFVLWDTDGNGIVSGAEYDRMGGGPKRYDLNGDATLTAEEYERYHHPAATPRQQQPGREGSTAPPAAAQISSGRYVCTGYGMTAAGGQGFVYKGEFTLLAGGRYGANRTTGRVAADGRTIRFSSGAYDGIAGQISRQDGATQIVLTWPGTRGSRSSTQYCNPAR